MMSGFLRRVAARFLQNNLSIALDNNRTTVVVVVTVLPDDNGLVTISAVTVPKMFTVTIAITVDMTLTHRYAATTYPDSDFLRCSRNCATNTHHGGDGYCVSNHCMLH
jgi:hypothetical protein